MSTANILNFFAFCRSENYVWIGLNDKTTEGNYEWTAGSSGMRHSRKLKKVIFLFLIWQYSFVATML